MVTKIETETDETAFRYQRVQPAGRKRNQLRIYQPARTLRLHQPENHPRLTPQVIAGGVDKMNNRDHEAIRSSLVGISMGSNNSRGWRRVDSLSVS